MTKRQQDILNAVIEEYSKSADPVGSRHLSESFNFGIKPAMIRQEMAVLEEKGFLTQPHTSAGRMPTDRAYRRYISQELQEKQDTQTPLSSKEQKKVSEALEKSNDPGAFLHTLSKLVAELSHELAVTGLAGKKVVFTAGLSELIDEPEMEDREYVRQLMQLIDEMDVYAQQLLKEASLRKARVLIGRENRLRPLRRLSLITRQYRLPQGERGFLSIIGPRRMNYQKNIALVEYVCRLLQK